MAMEPQQALEFAQKVVAVLAPHSSGDRKHIISLSLTALGEMPIDFTKGSSTPDPNSTSTDGKLPQRAGSWMKQYGVTVDALEAVFQISDGSFAVIVGEIPGKSKKEKTFNVYRLAGIAALLSAGSPHFSDANARQLCVEAGCYDEAHHSTYIKAKGSTFTGSKETGWTLTAPSLKEAAELIKAMTSA